MSQIKNILSKYIGNAEELIGALDDLSYAHVLDTLLTALSTNYDREKAEIENLPLLADKNYALAELNKLNQLIMELQEVRNSILKRLNNAIYLRYMK